MRPGIGLIRRIHYPGRAIFNADRVAAAQVTFKYLFMRADLYSGERAGFRTGQAVNTFLFVDYYGSGFRVLGHGLGDGAGFLARRWLAVSANGRRE